MTKYQKTVYLLNKSQRHRQSNFYGKPEFSYILLSGKATIYFLARTGTNFNDTILDEGLLKMTLISVSFRQSVKSDCRSDIKNLLSAE